MTSKPSVADGFTLIEFVVALVVLGLGAALLTSFITPVTRSADPMIQAQARAIASAYMDEILLREFAGDCAGGRGEWSGIQCYNGLNEQPTDQFGDAILDLADYRVSVSVDGGSPANILVDVQHSSGRTGFALQSARGDY
jgi:MSHA pilin protein MshD